MQIPPDSSLRRLVQAAKTIRSVRPGHFSPWRSSFAPSPPPLADLPPEEIQRANEASRRYFERESLRDFWLERPFSEAATAPRTLHRFGLLADALQILPGDRVLDFGCGSGWTSAFLARLGAEVVGMDISPAALGIARDAAGRLSPSAAARLRFEPFEGDRIAAAEGTFDTILVFDAFHHLPNPAALLAEFRRVLAADGRLAFAEPGLGHAEAETSGSERRHGILELNLDLESLFRSGLAAGFRDLELLVPTISPGTLTLPMKRARSFLRGRPWTVPPDLIRLALLEGPIGIFQAGPHRVTSANPRTLAARIRPRRESAETAAGENFVVEAEVRNEAETVWLRDMRRGRGAVSLGAHLWDESGRLVKHDFGRAPLSRDLAWGEKARFALRLTAPSQPGRYLLRLDMVDDGVAWFAERGSTTAVVRLEVVPSA